MQIKRLNQTDVAKVLETPGYIPWSIHGQSGVVGYLPFSEQQIFEAAFLDQRSINQQMPDLLGIPINDLLNHPQQHVSGNWLFHTSFCCSTLLARLLQVPQKILVIREPLVFNQLADAYRSNTQSQKIQPLFKGIAAQLSKRFKQQQQVLMKTSNYMNALLNHVAAIQAEAKVLLVWGSLDECIKSMLKHRREAQQTLPIFLRALQADYPGGILSDGYVPGKSFEQDIARVWVQQVNHFASQVDNAALNTGVVTRQQILKQPVETVLACDQFYGWPVKRDHKVIIQTMRFDSKQATIEFNSEKKLQDNATPIDTNQIYSTVSQHIKKDAITLLKSNNLLA